MNKYKNGLVLCKKANFFIKSATTTKTVDQYIASEFIHNPYETHQNNLETK